MHSNSPNTIKETLNAQYEQNDEGEIQLNNYVWYIYIKKIIINKERKKKKKERLLNIKLNILNIK